MSYLLLEVIDEMHLVQPSPNVQLSRVTPEHFLRETCRVIRKGYGYPSLFNADGVVTQLLRKGKSVEDAREGGTSGCVETGAFGKEAYILTGYFNLPKILELTLHDGRRSPDRPAAGAAHGRSAGLRHLRRPVRRLAAQLRHFIEIKIRGNALIERLYADAMPAPFLSVITDDCIAKGHGLQRGRRPLQHDLHPGRGHRHPDRQPGRAPAPVFDGGVSTWPISWPRWTRTSRASEPLRQRLLNRTPKWGNDDEAADEVMRPVFDAFVDAVDGRPNGRGGTLRRRHAAHDLPRLLRLGHGGNARRAPARRRRCPRASRPSRASTGSARPPCSGPPPRWTSARTGGTLLNMKLNPALLAGEEGIAQLRDLVRTYFRLGGHHVQFNVVSAETLREAQADPDAHRDLIVRVAGYSDYFCDLSAELQDEIIARTEHEAL